MRRKVDIEEDLVDLEWKDYFVVGYGMDVGNELRKMNYVGRVME